MEVAPAYQEDVSALCRIMSTARAGSCHALVTAGYYQRPAAGHD
jgi:hypothetical protein